MLAGICTHTHTRMHARTDPEEKGPRSPEEEQAHGPGTVEPTGEHYALEDGK